MMKKKLYSATVILIVMLALSACGGIGAQNAAELDGTSWVLFAYRNTTPIEAAKPTIAFTDGEVSGSASCNQYGGSYQVDGDKISFSAMFMTEMYCMEPEGVMEQESLYLEMLGNAESFELSEGQLMIFMADGETLTFVPAE
ncbi:MAG: META domain-containing protein [Anaerolineales bacterium]|jgi:heat shock protein HslJ